MVWADPIPIPRLNRSSMKFTKKLRKTFEDKEG